MAAAIEANEDEFAAKHNAWEAAAEELLATVPTEVQFGRHHVSSFTKGTVRVLRGLLSKLVKRPDADARRSTERALSLAEKLNGRIVQKLRKDRARAQWEQGPQSRRAREQLGEDNVEAHTSESHIKARRALKALRKGTTGFIRNVAMCPTRTQASLT